MVNRPLTKVNKGEIRKNKKKILVRVEALEDRLEWRL